MIGVPGTTFGFAKMGYVDEEFGPALRTRRVSAALQREIGAFFVAWGALEYEMDTAFPVLFRLDPTLAVCISANLNTRAKIDILSSAVDMLWEALGKGRVTSTQAILDRIRTLNDRARNTLAHGYHEDWRNLKTGKPQKAIVRYVARRQLTAVVHPGTVKHWRRMTRATLTTAARLRLKVDSLFRRLKTFNEDEIWRMTGLQDKEAPPVVLRHRKNPLPRRAFSKTRGGKRSKR